MIRVRRAGPLTTLQDLGRPGHAHLGVSRAGAVDEQSLRRANALLGNPPTAAALEATLLGPVLEVVDAGRLAIVGVDRSEVVDAAAGEVVAVGPVRRGVRVYVAVAGGFDVPAVLGSRSADTLSGLGPPPLRDGDTLATLPAPVQDHGVIGHSPAAAPGPVELPAEPVLTVHLGPRDDWFDPTAVETLLREPWTVTPRSDRVGVRLDGPPLRRRDDRELPSEGMVPGALQVPPDGRPILFLANGPTTGGYPVIAVVARQHLPVAGQLRPGSRVRFRARS